MFTNSNPKEETFRQLNIKGFERYYISNYGKVKSTIGTEKILKPYIQGKYYKIVLSQKTELRHPNIQKHFSIHFLVAYAFCDGYQEGFEVHHKDLNSLNNSADNLEWLSKEEHIEKHRKLKEAEKNGRL